MKRVIANGFDSEGLIILEEYADKFINGELVFKRFSPKEQQGCAEGGQAHVIATVLAGAENSADSVSERDSRLKGIFQLGAQQASLIEEWAQKVGIWIENVDHYLDENMGGEIAEGGIRDFSNIILDMGE